jgi:hypothetical protein
MGAETTVWVRVMRPHYEWIRVSAVTLADAVAQAYTEPRVIDVIKAQYEEPEDAEDNQIRFSRDD